MTAVVVGLCGHGLALTRSLSDAGIETYGLEVNSQNPGFWTSSAKVKHVADINGYNLIGSLKSLEISGQAVLILTNDHMVATIAEHYEEISDRFLLSWRECREQVRSLTDKDVVRARCEQVGMRHPKSRIVRSREDYDALDLDFPVIVKPGLPLSNYKTLLVQRHEQLAGHWDVISKSLPAIVQEFIPGEDDRIVFAAMYLDRGEVVSRFEGRKLRSRPMGHTTIAKAERNERAHKMARDFFGGLRLSGPVSLELKEGRDGELWAIEPTAGRTDFWVGLCIRDGVSFPVVEYQHQTGGPIPEFDQRDQSIWFNEERDPGALCWLWTHSRPSLRLQRSWLYLKRGDNRPFRRWAVRYLSELPKRAIRKLIRQPAKRY